MTPSSSPVSSSANTFSAAAPGIRLARFSAFATVRLPEHSSDTLTLIKAARHGVAKTWREPGERPWLYTKAGLVTNDLVPLSHSPRALIGALDRERSGPLMAAMDACNARWGRGAVVPARAGLMSRREWNTKFEMRTPRYTTQVSKLPVAYA